MSRCCIGQILVCLGRRFVGSIFSVPADETVLSARTSGPWVPHCFTSPRCLDRRLCRCGSSPGKRTTAAAGCSFPRKVEDTESVAPGSWMPTASGAASTLLIYRATPCRLQIFLPRRTLQFEPASRLAFWEDGFAHRSRWQKQLLVDASGHVDNCRSRASRSWKCCPAGRRACKGPPFGCHPAWKMVINCRSVVLRPSVFTSPLGTTPSAGRCENLELSTSYSPDTLAS